MAVEVGLPPGTLEEEAEEAVEQVVVPMQRRVGVAEDLPAP